MRTAQLLIKLSGVVITVIEVNRPSIKSNRLANFYIVSSQKLAVFQYVFFPFEELPLRYSRVLKFLLIDGNGVILEIKQHFDLPVSIVLQAALHHALLEVAKEP